MQDQAQQLRDLVLKARFERSGSKVIVVTSGKGGVGKTNVCVNLSIALSRRGFRVLMVDADFGLANIDVMLGLNSAGNLGDVLAGRMAITDVIHRVAGGVMLISGGSGLYDLLTMSDEQLGAIVNSLLQLEDIADIIIFDTAAGVSEHILRMVSASTETIIVTTPEPTAIMDAYAMVKTIKRLNDCPPVRILVNMAESYQEALDTLSSFSKVAGKYLHIELDQLGYVLNDPTVVRAVKMQTPFVLGFPNSIAARNMEAIADRFMEQPYKQDKRSGVAQFVKRLFRAGKRT